MAARCCWSRRSSFIHGRFFMRSSHPVQAFVRVARRAQTRVYDDKYL
jgi:hypothetical protein